MCLGILLLVLIEQCRFSRLKQATRHPEFRHPRSSEAAAEAGHLYRTFPFPGIFVLDESGAALEYAAIINDIRAAHGQDPIDFEGVPGIPAVDPVEGHITEDHPGVGLHSTGGQIRMIRSTS